MDKPGVPKPKKQGWRDVTNLIQQMPVASQNFTGIVIGVENRPLVRIGFTMTQVVSLTQGTPILVPLSGDLKGAPDFILKMTNRGMRCWTRGERKRVILPS